MFAVVQAAADAGEPLRVRLATLLPRPRQAARRVARDGDGRLHYYAGARAIRPAAASRSGAELADQGARAPRYPTDLRKRVGSDRARAHAGTTGAPIRCARGGWGWHGTAPGSPSTCSTTRRRICAGRRGGDRPLPEKDLERVARFRTVLEQERVEPASTARSRDQRRRPDRPQPLRRPRDGGQTLQTLLENEVVHEPVAEHPSGGVLGSGRGACSA